MTCFSRVAATSNPRAILWQAMNLACGNPSPRTQILPAGVCACIRHFSSWGAQKRRPHRPGLPRNRWEWPSPTFAALAIGAVDVPIYPTLTGEQIAALVADAAGRIRRGFPSRQQFGQAERVRSLTQLRRITDHDSPAPEGANRFRGTCWPGPMSAEPSATRSSNALAHSVEPKDLAT